MTTNIIAATEAERPTNTYTDLARHLHAIAHCIATIDRQDLAGDPYVYLSILPTSKAEEPTRVATVDALLTSILGKTGKQQPASGGGFTHIGRGQVGPVEVSVHTKVAGPGPDEVQAELIRLRAENERLRAELADDEVEAYPDRAEAVAS